MQCKACGSHNQTEFNAEINVHFPGLKNLDKPAILVFSKLLLCLDCGFTEFTLSESELLLLGETRLSENGIIGQ
jgi:predicted nucleic-acid-binding Zn-ribbon protein